MYSFRVNNEKRNTILHEAYNFTKTILNIKSLHIFLQIETPKVYSEAVNRRTDRQTMVH